MSDENDSPRGNSKWNWSQDPANPDAAPAYCPVYWFGGWSIEEWMQWHAAMKKRYGLTYANQTFVDKWFNHGTLEIPPVDKVSASQAFRDYATANNFLDSMYQGSAAQIFKSADAVGDVVVDTTNNLLATGKSMLSFTKWLPYIIPIGALFVAAIFIIPIFAPQFKRAKKAVSSKS